MPSKDTTPLSLYGNDREYLREQERTNELLADIAGETYESPGNIPNGKYILQKRMLDAAQKKNELLESIAGSGGGGGAAKGIDIDYGTDVISLKNKDGDPIQGSGATLPAYGVSFDPTTGGLTLTKNGTAMQGQTVTIPNYGSPVGVTDSADMVDEGTIYLYEGTTGGGYTQGHFYYWDGTAWADGGEYAAATVQTDKTLLVENRAADAKATGEAVNDLKESLYGLKADFGAGIIKTVTGKNMFNKNTVHTGKKLDLNTGGYTSTDYPAWFVSDYIPIEPDTVYTLRQSNTARICYYDNEQTYLNIYDTPTVNGYNLTTPANAKYLRFALMNNYLDSEQLEKGTAFTSYEAYKLLISDDSDLDISDNVKTTVEDMGLSPIDFSRLNLAYIKDGKCVCNDEKSQSLSSTAKYIGVDLINDIVSAEIRFGFHSETGSGNATIMLITTKLGDSSTAHIVNGSCHFAVNRTHALIEYFDESHEITATHDHVFAEPLDFDTEYAFKWKIVNSNGSQWVSVTYPDGETELLTRSSDAQFWETNGRYIIFEHFYNTSSACRPYYTGWYAQADDGNGNSTYLRHDISAYSVDGPLTVAPTGQTYTLFSNEIWGGTALDVK